MVALTALQWLGLGLRIAGYIRWKSYKEGPNRERFSKAYGAVPETCVDIWQDLVDSEQLSDTEQKRPMRLLIALRFLWKYEVETDLARFFRLTEKTVRGHVHVWVPKVESLFDAQVGSLEDYADEGVIFLLSIDGTHCPIEEPRPFSTGWSSHKFGGSPGVNYEICLLINRPQLAWVYGPIPPGKMNDISTFKHKLMGELEDYLPGKRLIGDKGYRGVKEFISTRNEFDPENIAEFKDRVLARHETFNQSLKCFKCLSLPWRHGVGNHSLAFRSCCVIVMYQISNGTFMLFDAYL